MMDEKQFEVKMTLTKMRSDMIWAKIERDMDYLERHERELTKIRADEYKDYVRPNNSQTII